MAFRLTEKHKTALRLVQEGLSQTAAAKGAGISRTSWYRYRRDPDFDKLVQRAVEEGKQFKRDLRVALPAGTRDGWKEDFITFYVDGRCDFQAACKRAGVRPFQALDAMNPRHADYDEEFSFAMDRADRYLEMLAKDNVVEDLVKRRQGAASARWVLERVGDDRWKTTQHVKVDQNHTVVLDRQTALEVVQRICTGQPIDVDWLPASEPERIENEPAQLPA